jgi:hypothetical protein
MRQGYNACVRRAHGPRPRLIEERAVAAAHRLDDYYDPRTRRAAGDDYWRMKMVRVSIGVGVRWLIRWCWARHRAGWIAVWARTCVPEVMHMEGRGGAGAGRAACMQKRPREPVLERRSIGRHGFRQGKEGGRGLSEVRTQRSGRNGKEIEHASRGAREEAAEARVDWAPSRGWGLGGPLRQGCCLPAGRREYAPGGWLGKHRGLNIGAREPVRTERKAQGKSHRSLSNQTARRAPGTSRMRSSRSRSARWRARERQRWRGCVCGVCTGFKETRERGREESRMAE